MTPPTFPQGGDERSTALGSLAEELRRRIEASKSREQQVLRTFEKLRKRLAEVAEGQEARDAKDGDSERRSIDSGHVEKLLSAGKFDSLSAQEARFVVASFLDRKPVHIRGVLEHHPTRRRLWKVYLRKMLAGWYMSREFPLPWMQFCELASRAPGDLSLVGGPIPLSVLVRGGGAEKAADAVEASSLQDCYATLTEKWGYGRSWDITAAATLTWIRRKERDLDSEVNYLATASAGATLRGLLLPGADGTASGEPGSTGGVRGREVIRQIAVSELLRLRFEGKRISDSTFQLLEPFLLRGSFGDPRLINVNDSWQKVKQVVPGPYREYLQSLIREDLEFFFQQSMEKDDRKKFWLGYIRSIQRTICVLGPSEHLRLRGALASSPPATKAALDRAVCAQCEVQGKANAFCLIFDRIAVVEFSDTGHAAYAYTRHEFDHSILPQVTSGRINKVTDLKKKGDVLERLLHLSGWQEKMESFLSGRGISAG